MKENYKILIVDDEPNNLKVLKQILGEQYLLLFATNGEAALEASEQHQPDLILLDVMMPGIDGYEVCCRLKNKRLTSHIPVIFVTAMGDIADESKGFDVGAVDYIHKPVCGQIVRRRVQTHLSLVRTEQLEQLASASIHMLGQAGHYNDTDTGEHIWRMASFSAALAKAAGWSLPQCKTLQLAAPMHDTGKIGIPHEILKAPRKLTLSEWEIMKQHTVIGHNILALSDNPVFQQAAEIALHHHERWDGNGYPHRLAADAIPESARIIAIADVFDALTMQRPYKSAWHIDDAVEEIKKGAGSHFDPELSELFIQIMPEIIEIKQSWDARERVVH